MAKVEGRGNGIKTRIVNCADIAAALHRKPAVVIKFFGCELGAQSRWDEKEEAAIVNGAFEGNVLQDKLCDSFLPKFVLCPNCGLPETDMKVPNFALPHVHRTDYPCWLRTATLLAGEGRTLATLTRTTLLDA